MRALQILNWILLAASGVITLVLAVVCLLFWLHQSEPLIQTSFERLRQDTVLFAGLTTLAAAAAFSLSRPGWMRWPLQGTFWAALAGAVWHYLPVPA